MLVRTSKIVLIRLISKIFIKSCHPWVPDKVEEARQAKDKDRNTRKWTEESSLVFLQLLSSEDTRRWQGACSHFLAVHVLILLKRKVTVELTENLTRRASFASISSWWGMSIAKASLSFSHLASNCIITLAHSMIPQCDGDGLVIVLRFRIAASSSHRFLLFPCYMYCRYLDIYMTY